MTTIKDQVRGLPTEQKVELIKFLADSLSENMGESKPLEFGKYKFRTDDGHRRGL